MCKPSEDLYKRLEESGLATPSRSLAEGRRGLPPLFLLRFHQRPGAGDRSRLPKGVGHGLYAPGSTESLRITAKKFFGLAGRA